MEPKTAESQAEILPDHCAADVAVLCCGNVLLGDDGFGPAVARRLNEGDAIPDEAIVLDAGTAVRELLFDVLVSERRPGRVVLVDAVDVGRPPGDVFELELDRLPKLNVSTVSLHQAPTTNLLRELRDETDVDVSVVVCQVTARPDEVCEGLSPAVEAAVAKAADLIASRYLSSKTTPRPARATKE